MKSTGFVKIIDKMGRIVLPMEIRKILNLTEEGSAVELFTQDDMVVLKKYQPGCIFCHNADNLIDYHGVKICEDCIAEMSDRVKSSL